MPPYVKLVTYLHKRNCNTHIVLHLAFSRSVLLTPFYITYVSTLKFRRVHNTVDALHSSNASLFVALRLFPVFSIIHSILQVENLGLKKLRAQ